MSHKNISRVLLTIFFSIGIILVAAVVLTKLINKPFVEFDYEDTYKKKNNIDISIGIYTGEDPFHFTEPDDIVNPILTAKSVKDVEADFVADPFMIFEENRWYLFFEVMNKKSGNGDIGLATSDDGKIWKYQKIILDEPFHLSYPFVFKTGGTFYMIPETNAEKTIRLYKATNFPFEWKIAATLLSGLNFTDSTILYYHDKWWIFTETDSKKDGTLRLYYADDIFGKWIEHPQSPIIKDDENIARPGGRVIVFNDGIYRVAQDDWPTYGNRLRIFQIDNLTIHEYSEHEICETPVFETKENRGNEKTPDWFSAGMHQLDAHQIRQGYWMACVDGLNRVDHYRQKILKIRIPFTKKQVN